MSAVMTAQFNPTVISLESEGSDLALEGFKEAILNPVKTIKAHFNTTNEAMLQKQLAEKRAVIANERKNLGKVKTALASSKISSHVIKMGTLRKHLNFSARTPEDVVAGLVKNRKMLEGFIKEFEKAKTKEEAKAIENRVIAATQGRGSMPDEMTFTKVNAQAYVNENLALLETMDKYLTLVEKSYDKLSTEGIGTVAMTVGKLVISGFVVVAFAKIAVFAMFAIAGAVAITSPFLGLATGLVLFGITLKGADELGTHLGKWIAGDYEKPSHLTAV